MRIGIIGLSLCIALMSSLHACSCGPTGGNEQTTTPDGVVIQPDGRVIGPGDSGPTDTPSGVDAPAGCPADETVQMTSEKDDGVVFGVLCPPPTITGCYHLEGKEACTVADVPIVQFIFDTNAKTYRVSHAGSIEDNSHGKLEAAPDATQPDRLTGLPEKTKIKASFSGISITFQFTGDEVQVFKPQ